MPYATVFDLDPNSVEAFERLADLIDETGASFASPRRDGIAPHLTLAVYDDLDVAAMQRDLETFVPICCEATMTFQSIGCFPGPLNTIYSAPTVSGDLLAIHRTYHEHTSRQGHGSVLYHPGIWIPHITLASQVSLSDVGQLITTISRNWIKSTGFTQGLRLIRFYPPVTVWNRQFGNR